MGAHFTASRQCKRVRMDQVDPSILNLDGKMKKVVILGLLICMQNSSFVDAGVMKCQSNGFLGKDEISIEVSKFSKSLVIDESLILSGQFDRFRGPDERAKESLWFKGRIDTVSNETKINAYLYDKRLLIETIELPILSVPCTPMNCEEKQQIYRIEPCEALK